MPISYKKNRAMNRILRNKFHAAPESKLHAEPEKEAPAAYSLSAEIPKSYNDTYVRAIPKDPQSTFVYWEMPEKNAEGSGMEANGKAHTGNGEAAAIQNKVNGVNDKPHHDGDDNGHAGNDNHQDIGDNRQDNNSQGNANHGQNQGLYYDFESNSWRSGNHPQEERRDYDNHQTYCHNNDDNAPDGQHHQERQNHHDYGVNHDSHQTYRHDDNSRRRNGRHYRHNHDNLQHYQRQQQYYGHPEYSYILTEFIPPDSIGRVYMETPGIAAGTAVLTEWRSILLDICKSQVHSDTAVMPGLSSGVLQKKTVVAPPPHLSSGILYNNPGTAGQP